MTNRCYVVGSKWVYHVKFKKDGSLDCYKARLVDKSYTQVKGLDYDETFNPVIKPGSTCLILSIAVSFGWIIQQLDVKNAFLHGTLKEQVFMEQPPGFVDEPYSNYVCLLKKSLHGLKQAPRAWFDLLSQSLIRLGFKCSRADPSLFIFQTTTDIILLLIYMDDVVLTSFNPSLLGALIHRLNKDFDLMDLSCLHYFLGIEVRFFHDGLYLSQPKYAHDVLQRASRLGAALMETPIYIKQTVHHHDSLLVNPTEYRSLADALQYLIFTQPDVQHAVNQVCQHFQNPT